jgi:hypothetical protein
MKVFCFPDKYKPLMDKWRYSLEAVILSAGLRSEALAQGNFPERSNDTFSLY